MGRWIVKNFRTFLWALALAVAVWIAAVTSSDPDETRLLTDPVTVEIVGQDPGLIVNSDIPKSIELTLRAPRSVWNSITANSQSVRAILDLSGLSAGEHTLAPQIQINARPVQIVSVAPGAITFVLEPLATRVMNVELNMTGKPAIGYQLGQPVLDPMKVAVSGAQSEIQRVARVRLSLNLDGIRDNFDKSLPLEILDADNQPIVGLSISQDTAHVSMLVTQQGGYRDMAVKVVVTGQVASGYRLTNISVLPPVITVYAADPELVDKLPGVVETQALDLKNADADITTRLELSLPEGITVVGEQTVLIQAGISPIESSLTLENEKVQVIGLPDGMTVQISPVSVDVIVSGPLPLLDTLTRQDVRVTVDLTGLKPGTHQLIPKVEILLSDVVVESILPGTIEVILIGPGSITPTVMPTLTPFPTATP